MAFASLSKLAKGLARTRDTITGSIRNVLSSDKIDEASLEDLEETLLAADLGPALTEELIELVRRNARKAGTDDAAVREGMRASLRQALPEESTEPARCEGPRVLFVVGVNGGGKTTTVGKLAALERAAGREVIIAAADTFRAAAVEQVERWSERAGVQLIKQATGADPAAVVFDALKAAVKRGVDTVIVDTAGRLHTKVNLMAELSKLSRVASREVAGAPHEVLLVVDATTGQNGLAQAEEFTRASQLTGVVLTKLDGTAKGGVALGIHRKLGLPIRYVGVGEGVDDLLPFDPDAFVDGLLG